MMRALLPLLSSRTRCLEPHVNAGLFSVSDVHVAHAIAETHDESDRDVIFASALCARAVRLGHVCVPLDRARRGIFEDGERDVEREALWWPNLERWEERLRQSGAVQVGGAQDAYQLRPLVLDGGRLYLDRYWHAETLLGSQLLARASEQSGLFVRDPEFEQSLRLYIGDEVDDELQFRAALNAMTRRFTVIAGGPGTGKTRTVARLIAAAHRFTQTRATRCLIALTAPTATAAMRLNVALARELTQEGDLSGGDAIPEIPEAKTLHRLLGSRYEGGFHFDHRRPLPHDMVIVDEASMVSLVLMERLFDALRPDASVVLVGDPHQLASVEAGAVLGEIVRAGENVAANPLSTSIVQLEGQYRFGATSPIAHLAEAIRTGDADDALSTLVEGSSAAVTWLSSDDASAIAEVESHVVERALAVVEAARDGDIVAALEALREMKVVAATRFGPLGTRQWTERIEQAIARARPAFMRDHRWYVGRPIIVNRNDYLNRLLNGDVGVIIDRGHRVAAMMHASELVEVPLARLSDVDTWWAMTIHKSQGSEFEHVVVSLPEVPSPVLTRELLYTAITRARMRVTIIASEESLRTAIACPADRFTGLGDRLRSGTFL